MFRILYYDKVENLFTVSLHVPWYKGVIWHSDSNQGGPVRCLSTVLVICTIRGIVQSVKVRATALFIVYADKLN